MNKNAWNFYISETGCGYKTKRREFRIVNKILNVYINCKLPSSQM